MELCLVPLSYPRAPPPAPVLNQFFFFFFFFFFFHWHYSPLWALTCRTMSFNFLPTCHQLSPISLPALEDLFLLPLSIFSWVFRFFFFFFFFHWHYSPLWALACRTMSFHFSLSATNSLHLLTPST